MYLMSSFRCLGASLCEDSKRLSAKRWTCGPGNSRAYDGSSFCIVRVAAGAGGADGGSAQRVVMGALVGVVLALCVGLLLFLARKNPRRIKKIFFSFLRTEVRLGLNVFLEVYGMHGERGVHAYGAVYIYIRVFRARRTSAHMRATVTCLRVRVQECLCNVSF